MVISKKYFNSCTLYVLLWALYSLQGTLYASGSIISRGILAIIMLMSVYYTWMVCTSRNRLPAFLKVLTIFLAMITAYGVVAILDPTPIYFDFTLGNTAPKYEFIKTAYMSLLPIYVFYYFNQKGLLTENVIRAISIFLFVITTISFIRYQNEMLIKAATIGSTREEFTNNKAYGFLQLIPMVFFWQKKPLIQYILAAYIFVFLVMGMKRGAILIGAVCFLWFIYRTWKVSRGKQRFLIILISTILAFVGIKYLGDFYASSDYFQQRVEQTAEGLTSGRDIIYITLWEHFINETSVAKILFGNGALQTIKIAGNFAHNDWLEIAINHGLFGIAIYLWYFIALVKCWLKSKHNRLVYSILSMIILIMFASTLFSMSYNSLDLSITICLGYCLAQANNSPKPRSI